MAVDKRGLYARQILAAQEAIALPLRRRVQAELTRVAKALSKEYADNGVGGFEAHLARHREEMASIFRHSAGEVVKTFASKKKSVKRTPDAFETQLEWDVYYALLAPLSEDAYQAAGYSLELAREVVASGVAEELTTSQVAANIYKRVGGVPSRSRAITIARTEVHMAANTAQHLTAAAAGVEMEKEWISTSDGRTRDSHRHMDGVKVALTDKFQVGTDLMAYPGDRSGSAKNIINCRCVVGYTPVGD